MKTQWAVIFITSWTQSQRWPPELFATKAEAEARANGFNKWTQDHTWNALVAHVIFIPEGFHA